MEPDDRAAVEEALSYPEESAGRLMQRELCAVPEHWKVGQVIDYLRSTERPADRFLGSVRRQPGPPSGRHLQAVDDPAHAAQARRSATSCAREQTLIPVDMDQEDVALRFQKYALVSAAVIDDAGRLVGMITVDDIVHIIQEEAGEDVLLLSGAGDGDINEPIRLTVRRRLFWLVINLGTAILAASVVSLFQGEIGRYAVLAVLMPIVAGHGRQCRDPDARGRGARARHQPADRIEHGPDVRARADDRARQRPFARPPDRRPASALIFDNPLLGAVMGAAMVINNLAAGLGGIFVPVTLDRLRRRPGGVLRGVRHHHHRRDGLLQLPRPCQRWSASAAKSVANSALSFGIAQGVPKLHLTKVAFGCRDLEALREADRARARHGGEVRVPTRMRPKRADELIGGSLHWIVKHRLIAGQRDPALRGPRGRPHRHRLLGRARTVAPTPRRAHQGWRYLEEATRPADDDDGSGLGRASARGFTAGSPRWLWYSRLADAIGLPRINREAKHDHAAHRR